MSTFTSWYNYIYSSKWYIWWYIYIYTHIRWYIYMMIYIYIFMYIIQPKTLSHWSPARAIHVFGNHLLCSCFFSGMIAGWFMSWKSWMTGGSRVALFWETTPTSASKSIDPNKIGCFQLQFHLLTVRCATNFLWSPTLDLLKGHQIRRYS